MTDPGPSGALALTESAAGLSSMEAAARLDDGGANVLPAARSVPLWQRVGAQLRDPLVVVQMVAAVMTVVTGDWTARP